MLVNKSYLLQILFLCKFKVNCKLLSYNKFKVSCKLLSCNAYVILTYAVFGAKNFGGACSRARQKSDRSKAKLYQSLAGPSRTWHYLFHCAIQKYQERRMKSYYIVFFIFVHLMMINILNNISTIRSSHL